MKIRTVLVVLTMALSGVFVAEPAHAATRPRLVTMTGPLDSPASSVVTAACPSGMSAVGGGGIVFGSDKVRINGAVPTPDGFTMLAVEPTGGVAERWQLIVTAVCVDTFSLTGLQYVTAASAADSATDHTVTVACPAGLRVIGLGGLITSQAGGQHPLIITSLHAPDQTTVRIWASETLRHYAGSWKVKATAVCAYPLPGLTTVNKFAGAPTERAVAVAACPAGTTVLSTGFKLYRAFFAAAVHAFYPDVDVAGAPAQSGTEVVAREIDAGPDEDWGVIGQAICAR
jgi:hypothetical protein